MRTRSVGLGLLILGIAILTFAGSSPVPAEEQVTLRYSVFFPATHVQSKLAEEWAKEVEKRTNGKVKIEY